MLRFVAAILLFTAYAWCSPTGAPEAACGNMNTQHNGTAQTGEAPYIIDVVSADCPSGATGCYEVAISGGTFRGFFLQARYIEDEDPSEDQIPQGTWEVVDAAISKLRPCAGGDDGVTHIDREDKDGVVAYFNPGGADVAGMQIMATVVQQYDTWWWGLRVPL